MPAQSAPILFSAAEDYLGTAMAELRGAFPKAHVAQIGPDLGSIIEAGLSIGDIADAAQATSFIFVRHLMRQVGFIPDADATDIDAIIAAAWSIWSDLPIQSNITLQVWSSGDPNRIRPDELRRSLQAFLIEQNLDVARSGRENILSLVLTAKGIAVGFNSSSSALSDWPGGSVRLAKPKNQISRSEFKLEELFREYPIRLPESGRALDLGASPGGWTRILRQHGLEVWAVDPADLHPSLSTDSGVHHVRSTAGPFLAAESLEFDIVVNDMRMDPELSSQLMLDAARMLRIGGLIILTLKLSPSYPVDAINRSLTSLARWYDVELVRQLHHNRHEVTIVARRRAEHHRV
ncbi:MAG: SAM-dependent methyltransferase [Thermomicrobiales bacterium]